jgi:hypothetical protein
VGSFVCVCVGVCVDVGAGVSAGVYEGVKVWKGVFGGCARAYNVFVC